MRPRASVLTALLLCPAASAQGPSLTDILTEMGTFVEPCVQPTAGPRVFTHCLDTHSSIHAHWAAYRIARVLPSQSHLALTSDTALEYDKVRNEVQFMSYPYAAAWFLRLAIEFEKWSQENGMPDPHRIRPVADRMADYLLDYYLTHNVNPLTPEYLNPSWALFQLHAYYDFIHDGNSLAVTDSIIDQNFLGPIQGTSFGADLNNSGFFSVYGNWNYVVVKTQDKPTGEQFLANQTPIPDAHLAVNNIGTAHSYGLGWSRVWALRAMAARTTSPHDRKRFRRSANEHIVIGMQRHAQLQGSFFAYDHWVPQFIVYAVTEGTGFD